MMVEKHQAPETSHQLPKSNQKLWELFRDYREYVKHQYELTNHRTTWFVGMNTFLFATFGLALQTKINVSLAIEQKNRNCTSFRNTCSALSQDEYFLLIIALVGAISCVVAYFLIEAARRPIGRIQMRWEKRINTLNLTSPEATKILEETSEDWLFVVGGMSRRNAWWGRMGAPALPILLSFVWPIAGFFCAYFNGIQIPTGVYTSLATIIILLTVLCPVVITVNIFAYFFNLKFFPNPGFR